MNMYIVNYLNIMWVRTYSPTQLNIQQKVHILTLGPLSLKCALCAPSGEVKLDQNNVLCKKI